MDNITSIDRLPRRFAPRNDNSWTLSAIPYLLLIICITIIFSGCGTAKIKGNVFLDENNNGLNDINEKHLGHVDYEVTLDGSRLFTSESRTDGSYEIEVKNDGRYCITITDSLELSEDIVVNRPLKSSNQFSTIKSDSITIERELITPKKIQTAPKASAINFMQTNISSKAIIAGDKDGDGVADYQDNCPSDSNESQTDTDEDGIGDVCDNCKKDENKKQLDSDDDGVGDECDNCPKDKNEEQEDADDDDIGDICDKDKNKKNKSKKDKKDPPATKERESCISMDKSDSDTHIDVYLKKDFSGSMVEIPEEPLELQAGKFGQLVFVFPKSCKIDQAIILPNDLQQGTVWDTGIDASISNIDFSIDVDETETINTASNVIKDDLVAEKIIIIANPEAEDSTHSISTEATCPDGKTIQLSKTIVIHAKDDS